MKEEENKIELSNIKEVDKIIANMLEDETQDVEVTCCNVEITQEIKEVGLCPKCLEHI
tara:strand:+ start:593 stop:766 length:174 start_codon:yes stop_codon:yes gene_type:complete